MSTAARRTDRTRLGRGTLALLLVVALALAGAIATELLTDPRQVPAADPVAVAAPTSGAWYCPVTGAEEETATVTVADVGGEPSTLVVVRHRGEGTTSETVELEPGTPYELELAAGEARFATTVRWSGGPVVASWHVDGTDNAGARCETAPAPLYHVTGFDTTAQSVSTLHLYNPFGVDAVARVVFGTPTGPVARVLTDNILVPAEGTTTVALNEYEPEQPDLAVTVEVLTGRVVTQGVVALAPTANQPAPTGRDVLPGAPAPGLAWTFAYARADEGSSSWLSIYNPNTREAAVEVRVANPLPDGSVLLGEVSIPAGGVARVELADTSASTEFGVTVIGVNEEPVVVSRLTAVATSGGAEGVSASSGSRPSPTWALVGAGAEWQTRVALYNAGAEPAVVTVDAGPGTPPAWRAVDLGPNEHVALELAEIEDLAPAVALLVTADLPVTADLRLQISGETLRYWTVGGVPSSVWEGPGSRPAVRRDARLSTRPAAEEPPEDEAAEG